MPTYERYLDDIETAVYSPGSADPDLMRDAAAEYAEACAQANQRLREVGHLLQQGLRSEAIQVSEQEPNLLDLVTMLDFPELSQWCDLLQGWGMVTPPPLLIDIAAQLNQAYAEQVPLETVLRAHRMLALGRAPLTARIVTLQRILELDPHNVAWQEDLVNLQRARIKQIEPESQQALRRKDAAKLASLDAELAAEGWCVQLPPELVRGVSETRRTVGREQARHELEAIEAELTSAHAAFDVESGRTARDRWQQAAVTAELSVEEPLADRAAPALEWLAEDDRRNAGRQEYASNIRALEAAIDEDQPIEELERLYRAVSDHEEGVPPPLASRLKQRISSIELADKRKHRVILTSIIGGLLIIGTAVIGVWLQQSHRRTVASSAMTLKTLVDEQHLNTAQQYYDRLEEDSPRVAGSAEVQHEKARIESGLQEETDRRKSFLQEMDKAENSGVEQPDRPALGRARELALGNDEKARVAELESLLLAFDQKTQRQIDEKFDVKLSGYHDRLRELQAATSSANELSSVELTQLLKDLSAAEKDAGGVSPPLLAQLRPIKDRVTAIIEDVGHRESQKEAIRKITSAVGNVEAYQTASVQFADRFPESTLAGDFKRIAEEVELWRGFEGWINFLSQPTFTNLRAITPEQAKTLLTQGDELKATYGIIPLVDKYSEKRGFLESVAARAGVDGKPLEHGVKALLSDPLVSSPKKLWMIETNDGDRYYLQARPNLDSNKTFQRFTCLVGFDLERRDKNVMTKNIVYEDVAPQSLFAHKAAQHLSKLTPRNWENTFLQILRDLFTQERIDPVVRLVLLKKFLEPACEGSLALTEAFREHRQTIENTEVDLSVDWMNPDSELAQEARHRATSVLSTLEPINQGIKRTISRLAIITARSPVPYRWIGWLGRDTMGQWQLYATQSTATAGDLFVTHHPPKQDRAVLGRIGRMERGSTIWSGGASELFIEGRPVYFRDDTIKD